MKYPKLLCVLSNFWTCPPWTYYHIHWSWDNECDHFPNRQCVGFLTAGLSTIFNVSGRLCDGLDICIALTLSLASTETLGRDWEDEMDSKNIICPWPLEKNICSNIYIYTMCVIYICYSYIYYMLLPSIDINTTFDARVRHLKQCIGHCFDSTSSPRRWCST